jgi:hypothetical protein
MQKTETLQWYLNLYKTHSKQIKDLNVVSESLKLVQENLGKILEDVKWKFNFPENKSKNRKLGLK